MSKDRRLGRGLAALLGTPMDETNIVDGSAVESSEATGLAQSPGVPRTSQSQTPMQAQRPRVGTSGGVTGSVPLAAVLPALSGEETDVRPNVLPISAAVQPRPESAAPASGALELDVSLIDANPFQPRRQFNDEEIASLAESIKEHQQLQPVLVRKVGNRYQLISGERRLRATIHAGLTKVRAEVREADDRLVAELAIVENLQRKDLNPIEKALSFRRYLDEHECTQVELAERLKIDRSTIANLCRLLELPEPILEAVQTDKLSAGHARALLPLGEESQQLALARQIQAEGWSVRQTEHTVSEMLANEDGTADEKPGKGKRGAARTVTPQISSMEQELRRSLGTKIEIRQSARGKGKIVVHFHSAEEFERIREILVPGSRAAA